MMNSFTYLVWAVILCLLHPLGVNCGPSIDPEFQPDTTQHCLGEPVEYHCLISAIGINILKWTILQENGTQFGSVYYSTLNLNQSNMAIGELFSFELVTEVTVENLKTLASNISFIAEPSLDKNIIICEEGYSSNRTNITITVITPDSPGVVIVDPDSYTSSSVNISWTESPSVCDTTFSYNILSTNTIYDTTTSNNAVLGGLVPSDDPYCVIVTATDYTTRTSNQSCFLFTIAPAATNLTVANVIESNTVRIDVSWKHGVFGVPADVTVPDVTAYNVIIMNSGVIVRALYTLPPEDTEHSFTGIEPGATYTVKVEALNEIGYRVTSTIIVISPGPSSSTDQVSASTAETMSLNVDDGAYASPIVVIAGGAVGGLIIVVTLIIVIIVSVCVVKRNHLAKQSNSGVVTAHYEMPQMEKSRVHSTKQSNSKTPAEYEIPQLLRSSTIKLKDEAIYSEIPTYPNTDTTIANNNVDVEMSSNAACGQIGRKISKQSMLSSNDINNDYI